jgi:threonine dehydrogenase-like Zn-dependent dehydrogenase
MSFTAAKEKKAAKGLADANTMTASVILSPGIIQIKELALPKPGKGELRLKLEGTGVCASNIPVWQGREWFNYPLTPGEPGHEGWGMVDALGEGVDNIQVGDRVCMLSYHAYATHDIAPMDHVVKIPEKLHGKPFPGEPLGCAMNIFERSNIKSGHKVAIVGSGFLGLLLLQLCKSAGAETIAISRRGFSLEAAKNCGADHSILMDDHWKIIDKIKNITSGKFCDRVIEATGKEWPLNLSIEITKVRGKLIVAGFHQDGLRQVNMQMLNWRGIDMINAHEREPEEYISGMRKAIWAVEEGKMNPEILYTHEFQLGDLDKAFDLLVKRPDGFIKALIKY